MIQQPCNDMNEIWLSVVNVWLGRQLIVWKLGTLDYKLRIENVNWVQFIIGVINFLFTNLQFFISGLVFLLHISNLLLLYLCFIYFRFDGRVVARLPFVPVSWIQGLSHRNLSGDDYTECSFIFLYILCTMSIRQVRVVHVRFVSVALFILCPPHI